jgi:AcrR family transcriptional regulator
MTSIPRELTVEHQEERIRALDQVLDAAEELLANRTLDELHLTDVEAGAGVSGAAFYARFPNKEALVSEMVARYQRERLTVFNDELSAPAWDAMGLDERVNRLAEYFVTTYRRHLGMFRTLFFSLRSKGQGFSETLARDIGVLTDRCHALLGDGLERDGLPRDERAVHLAFYTLATMSRDGVLLGFDGFGMEGGMTDEELIAHVGRTVRLLLTPSPAAPTDATDDR